MVDVWKPENGNAISIDGNGKRQVRVAIYCRVSTDHEDQVKALENQIEWFNDIIPNHPNWVLVSSCYYSQSKRKKDKHTPNAITGYYIDEGSSGLSANRPALSRLMADAKAGMIDLILTREVCRFSRNIVDAVSLSRELKNEYGVAIYFYNDNIFTYDNDAEMKLGIFTTLAQNESQKISERVRAGQQTSRSKNILYGNGNILGYNLVKCDGGNHYEINEEQADTVRRIFELSLSGCGTQKIGDILVSERRKNSSGNVKWSYQNVLRILKNKTYCGYVAYNHTVSDNCISKKRKNVNEADREYHKVGSDIVPPIIEEVIWNECQDNLKKRSKEYFHSPSGSGKKTTAKDVFAKKLRCSCGNSFRKDIWHRNKGFNATYGYTCYNVLNHGKASNYSSKDEIEKLNICDMPAISSVKLSIQAVKVFENLVTDKSLITDAVNKATLKTVKFKESLSTQISAKENEIENLSRRNKKYLDLLADEIITKNEYLENKNDNDNQITVLQKEIEKLQIEIKEESKPKISNEELTKALTQIMDFENDVDDRLIDRFVYRIIVDSPTHFIWQLHFKPITTEQPSFVSICKHCIDLEFAKNYTKKHNKRLQSTQWKDIDVDVQISI